VTDTAEAWLLTWLPGQATDLHDHGGSAGAFVVVRGRLTEHTVVPVGDEPGVVDLRATRLPGGALRAFGRNHVHRIVNESAEPAVSVHVYGPALRSMTRYTLDARRLTVESVSKAGEDW
jgi:predicted metal-dependent enzyme (double-stranded beta helix superfamily)